MQTQWKSITLAEMAGLEMEGYEFAIKGDEKTIKVIPPKRE